MGAELAVSKCERSKHSGVKKFERSFHSKQTGVVNDSKSLVVLILGFISGFQAPLILVISCGLFFLSY